MKPYTGKGMFRRWWHLLFACPTFWRSGLSYTCPVCDKQFRCYWDGQHVPEYRSHCCNRCAKKIRIFADAYNKLYAEEANKLLTQKRRKAAIADITFDYKAGFVE